jgi:hypothetical protein
MLPWLKVVVPVLPLLAAPITITMIAGVLLAACIPFAPRRQLLCQRCELVWVPARIKSAAAIEASPSLREAA